MIQHFRYNAVGAVRYLHSTHKIYAITVDDTFLHLLNKFKYLEHSYLEWILQNVAHVGGITFRAFCKEK